MNPQIYIDIDTIGRLSWQKYLEYLWDCEEWQGHAWLPDWMNYYDHWYFIFIFLFWHPGTPAESPQPPIRADLRCGKWNVNFCVLTPIFLTFVVVVVTAVSCGTMRDKTVTKHFQFLWPDVETKLLQVLFNIHSTCLSAKHTCRY